MKPSGSVRTKPVRFTVMLSTTFQSAFRTAPHKEDLEQFLRNFARIPPAQRVTASLITIMERGEPDVASIAEIIKLDSSLATQVLRMSNSAFYAMQIPADSVDDAIIRLGYDETVKLANLAAITVLTQTEFIPVYPLNREVLWELSVVTGALMRMLAERSGLKEDMAYSAGLLHGVGRWIISQCLDEIGRGRLLVPKGSILEMAAWELLQTGHTHASIGGMAMAGWNYPDVLRATVEFHLNPFATERYRTTASMLNTAVKGANHLCLGEWNPLDKLRFDDAVLEAAGIDFDTFVDLLPEAKRELRSTYDLLKYGRKRRGDLQD